MIFWLLTELISGNIVKIADEAVFQTFNVTKEGEKSWVVESNGNISPKELNATISIEFEGNEVWLAGSLAKMKGEIIISVDDFEPKEMNFGMLNNDQGILFHAKLENENHKLSVRATSKEITLHGIYCCLGHKYISLEQLLSRNSAKLRYDEKILAKNEAKKYLLLIS